MMELILIVFALFSLLLCMKSICDENSGGSCDKAQCGSCPFPCVSHEERNDVND